MTIVDIRSLDKAAVLAALYNASQPLGLGFLTPGSGQQMTVEESGRVLAEAGDNLYFDYLRGRVVKVDLSGDEVDTRLYDRDNGAGSGAQVIEALRALAAGR